jgi:hypothetical protein
MTSGKKWANRQKKWIEMKVYFWYQGMPLWQHSNKACKGLHITIYPSSNFLLCILYFSKHWTMWSTWSPPTPGSLFFQLMQTQKGEFKHCTHLTLPAFVSQIKATKLGHECTNLCFPSNNTDAAKFTYLTVNSLEHSYIYICSMGSKTQSLDEITEEIGPM